MFVPVREDEECDSGDFGLEAERFCNLPVKIVFVPPFKHQFEEVQVEITPRVGVQVFGNDGILDEKLGRD